MAKPSAAASTFSRVGYFVQPDELYPIGVPYVNFPTTAFVLTGEDAVIQTAEISQGFAAGTEVDFQASNSTIDFEARKDDAMAWFIQSVLRQASLTPAAPVLLTDTWTIETAAVLGSTLTGTRIVDPLGTAFDPYIGMTQVMIFIPDATAVANRGFYRVERFWNDGTDSIAEIVPGYVGGPVPGGGPTDPVFGSPMADVVGDTFRIQIGSFDQQAADLAALSRCFAFLRNFGDVDQWDGTQDHVPGNLTMNGNPGSFVTYQGTTIGGVVSAMMQTSPADDGGTPTPGSELLPAVVARSAHASARNDTKLVALVTRTTETPIPLACNSLTSYSFALTSNNAGDDENVCPGRNGVIRGTARPVWTLGVSLRRDDVLNRPLLLSQLGREGTKEKALLDTIIEYPLGAGEVHPQKEIWGSPEVTVPPFNWEGAGGDARIETSFDSNADQYVNYNGEIAQALNRQVMAALTT